MKKILHILPNAHLDPVWLWDWREGLNEGVATCRSILALMDEFPELTFMRGEAAIYRHVALNDPATLERIREMYAAGRWDIVGGNYVQSDTNLPDTATFLRQYRTGTEYFREEFGAEITAAWAADSFGHSAGLPELYRNAGFRHFAFCRPAENLLHIAKPLFRWRAASGAEVLSWRSPTGGYCTERDQVPALLDAMLELDDCGLTNHAVFLGLGNHGGGVSRRQILDILDWRDRHGEVEVRFSTLHGFFAACEADLAGKPRDFIPTHEGELNFCLRGCHTSGAIVKWPFRRAEAALKRAEAAACLTAPLTGHAPEPLSEEWDGLLFNTFHDILPGTSILRAMQEQAEWIDGINHAARAAEFAAMNRLALEINITVPKPEPDWPQAAPRLFFNPRPTEFTGAVEVEACLDYRPSFDYADDPDRYPFGVLDEEDRPVAFQRIATEMEAIEKWPWRRRALVPISIPPGGWRVLKMVHAAQPPAAEFTGVPVEAEPAAVANEFYRVSAETGGTALRIRRADGTPLLAEQGLEFAAYFDPEGAWGSMVEDEAGFSCRKRLETWRIAEVRLIEAGPIRARLFVHFKGAASQVALLVSLTSGRDAVDVEGTLLWQDRAARLRLVADPAVRATYAVPGGEVVRQVQGDVPGGRWVKLDQACGPAAIASDVLTGFTGLEESFCVNLVRGCRASSDYPTTGGFRSERPIMDQGEHRFKLALTGTPGLAPELAAELELPVADIMCWPHPGKLPMQGATLEIRPAEVRCLALRSAGGRTTATLQSPRKVAAELRLAGKPPVRLELAPWTITEAILEE